jgi:hypothetical protein
VLMGVAPILLTPHISQLPPSWKSLQHCF